MPADLAKRARKLAQTFPPPTPEQALRLAALLPPVELVATAKAVAR